MSYPHYFQLDTKDCGPTCLRMLCKYYKLSVSENYLSKLCNTKRTGTNLLGISDAAEELGFKSLGVKITVEQLFYAKKFPCIVQWNKNHFVVIYKLTEKNVIVGDPCAGILNYPIEKFCKSWLSTKNKDDEPVGIALFIEPTDKLNILNKKLVKTSNLKIKDFIYYVTPQRKLLLCLVISVILGGFVDLFYPFLTQSIVDIGIENKSIKFIVIILLCQLSLSLGSSISSFISSWFVLHISSRLSISLVNHFLIKLMKLPVSFFSKKMIGDIIQRINDFTRIENFLTTSLIGIIIAILSLTIYGYILFTYGFEFIIVFMIGALLYIIWIVAFLKRRRKIDYMRFQENAENTGNIIHMITGMQEIKLNNCEEIQLSKWQKVQLKLYKINIQGLTLSQFQNIGGVFINTTKDTIITFMAAYAVIVNNITLGMMMVILYLLGQLNNPLSQIISFIRSVQDALISIERVNEINMNEDEDELNINKDKNIPNVCDIVISHLDFHYNGFRSPKVLDDINLTITGGKVTAIVGESGSGKTTLLKLLLAFYEPSKGEIHINGRNLNEYDLREWKKKCAAVMQNGYLFTDTIKNNIGLVDANPDTNHVERAAKQACIDNFITNLPLGYETIVGTDGNEVSMGQKQRILISRAIYKDAPYLFLDEATNSLDTNNEKQIMNNLNKFYKDKTVVVIAHRISTVMNADNIIVMSKGKIVEQGSHEQLLENKGSYYYLVKNQLNVG